MNSGLTFMHAHMYIEAAWRDMSSTKATLLFLLTMSFRFQSS